MNSRLDRQTPNIPLQMITDLGTDIAALKASNQILGPDSVLVQRVVSASNWDINGDSVAPYVVQQYQVVFTPTTMKNPFATFSYSTSITSSTGYEILYYWPDPTNTSSTSRSWTFTIANDSNTVNLFAKFILKCVDTGTFTVTKL
ncbi:hypothetical protein [Subtercola sp. RTI3]|uniref:hypothetical protein n=1 Tax=Subtercola sp. RTI3 TaxID=3048639 RepID=UPI002B22F73A|nr:hypothetical protein [Subtercola sp. RTI3]MEA9986260.1 hypothetical protein [Subtercola sp. RTI3]